MASDFIVVDPTGGLVNFPSYPYQKPFILNSVAPFGDAYLLLTVYTNYTDPADAAQVLLNGQSIGTIDPQRPSVAGVINVDTLTFVFDNALLTGPQKISFGFGTFLIPTVNSLDIAIQGNKADPNNYLLAMSATLHYHNNL